MYLVHSTREIKNDLLFSLITVTIITGCYVKYILFCCGSPVDGEVSNRYVSGQISFVFPSPPFLYIYT
jgi:hypothetical protein